MTCPNCGSETNGLKLNNRLYCTECGFLLSAPEPEVKPAENSVISDIKIEEPKKVESDEPVPKIITEEGTTELEEKAVEPLPKEITTEIKEFDLAPLEAEKEVLDLIEKEAAKLEVKSGVKPEIKLPKGTPVIKHNRKRTDLRHEGDFVLIPGEPDVIAEPEIESPETQPLADQAFVEAAPIETAKQLDQKVEEPTQDQDPRLKSGHDSQKALLDSFQKAVTTAPAPPVTHKQTKKKFNWKIYLAIFIPTFLLLSLLALVFYVNLYAIKPENALKSAQNKASFAHLAPGYLPAGYLLSYLTNGSTSSINYVYEYQPDKSRTITVTAEKTTLTTNNFYKEVIAKKGQDFVQRTNTEGVNFWLLDNHLYFVKDGVLYTISSSGEISASELENMANGLQ